MRYSSLADPVFCRVSLCIGIVKGVALWKVKGWKNESRDGLEFLRECFYKGYGVTFPSPLFPLGASLVRSMLEKSGVAEKATPTRITRNMTVIGQLGEKKIGKKTRHW